MNVKAKREHNRKAAAYVADLMLESLEQFPPEEREQRFQDARKILRGDTLKTRKPSKRSSKAPSPRVSRRAATPR